MLMVVYTDASSDRKSSFLHPSLDHPIFPSFSSSVLNLPSTPLYYSAAAPLLPSCLRSAVPLSGSQAWRAKDFGHLIASDEWRISAVLMPKEGGVVGSLTRDAHHSVGSMRETRKSGWRRVGVSYGAASALTWSMGKVHVVFNSASFVSTSKVTLFLPVSYKTTLAI